MCGIIHENVFPCHSLLCFPPTSLQPRCVLFVRQSVRRRRRGAQVGALRGRPRNGRAEALAAAAGLAGLAIHGDACVRAIWPYACVRVQIDRMNACACALML